MEDGEQPVTVRSASLCYSPELDASGESIADLVSADSASADLNMARLNLNRCFTRRCTRPACCRGCTLLLQFCLCAESVSVTHATLPCAAAQRSTLWAAHP